MRFAEKRFFTESGSPLHVLYSPKVEKDGSVELVESGVENFQEYIDSFKESTDLSTILARVGAGETELLFKRPGSYGDFTKLPQTYAEALQLQIDSNRLFGVCLPRSDISSMMILVSSLLSLELRIGFIRLKLCSLMK